MEFSLLQCTGKVGDKVRKQSPCRGQKSQKSATQITKLGNMICVTDFHDLCSRQSEELCRKVGVMKFGLNIVRWFTRLQTVTHPSSDPTGS